MPDKVRARQQQSARRDRHTRSPGAPAGQQRSGRSRVQRPVGALVVVAVGLLALFVAVQYAGGGAPEEPAPGLPDPGEFAGWGLRVSELTLDVAAVVTVGLLLFGVVLAPSRGADLRGRPLRAVHAAAGWALLWAVAAVATLAFTAADFFGVPVGGPAYFGSLAGFTAQSSEGQALLVVVVLALAIAAVARWVVSLNSAALLLVVAVGALLPPGFTGHSGSAANHDIATSSLIVHVVAASVWLGGLVALWFYGRGATPLLRAAAPRFSTLALLCFGATAASGVVNAWIRLGTLDQLWGSRYGLIVGGKVAVLAALGWFGWWHRTRTLAALQRSRLGAFVRFAAGELVVMATAVVLGVALSRTPTPVPEKAVPDWTTAESLVGYDLPPVTAERLWSLWRPDTLVLLVAALGVAGYLLGVHRLRQRGDRWPLGRTMALVLAMVSVVVVLCSGVATYGPVMFSVHMVQHMTLTMLVPILLALSAPITLALRALPVSRREGERGAREWILLVVHSRLAKTLTHPLVALALYVLTLYAFYFSPLFELAMRSHAAHLLLHLHFVGVGSLYFWPIIAQDPLPQRLPYIGRLLLLFASVPFHAFFGVIVMMSDRVIGAGWYESLNLPWVDLLQDQNLGGGIAWATGEIPTLLVLIAVFWQWRRSDEREARRRDRRADRSGDADLAAYNARLAELAAQDEGHERN